jgi:hypothetical protein
MKRLKNIAEAHANTVSSRDSHERA